jgi:N-acetylmuramoyl-L-alanine amidase
MTPLRLLAAVALVLLIAVLPTQAQFTVVIDPGHGGTHIAGKSDSTQEGDGASWNNAKTATKKLLEKDLTLSYALAVKQAFERSERARVLKIRVVLTRDRDVHLGAMERAAVAVRESADMLLSIHFNAANGKAEGTRAFFVSADHPDWEFMHFANPYEARDRRFCEMICQSVANALQPFGGKPEKRMVYGDVRDRKDGLRLLGFARQDTHLYNAAIGLLEVEFIDNPDVEAWLVSDASKAIVEKAAAEAIVNATCDWFSLPAAERDFVQKARKAPGR